MTTGSAKHKFQSYDDFAGDSIISYTVSTLNPMGYTGWSKCICNYHDPNIPCGVNFWYCDDYILPSTFFQSSNRRIISSCIEGKFSPSTFLHNINTYMYIILQYLKKSKFYPM